METSYTDLSLGANLRHIAATSETSKAKIMFDELMSYAMTAATDGRYKIRIFLAVKLDNKTTTKYDYLYKKKFFLIDDETWKDLKKRFKDAKINIHKYRDCRYEHKDMKTYGAISSREIFQGYIITMCWKKHSKCSII